MEIKRILFVCTGNTCRSYMAEIMANEYLHNNRKDKREESEVCVLSGGTGCIRGEPATDEARTVLAEMGYTAGEHAARELDEDLISQAELILTMTEAQKNQVLRRFPEAEGKVHLLKAYAFGDVVSADSVSGDPARAKNIQAWEIADPFGRSLEFYRKCGRELQEAVQRALDKALGMSKR